MLSKDDINNIGAAYLKVVAEKNVMVCKDCGDECGKPTNEECPHDCMDKNGDNWVAKSTTEALDPVNKDELKGKHKDRKDKDIDNDGDVDDTDKYLHKRRKAISKSDDEEEANEGKRGFIAAAKAAKDAGEKHFMFAGKRYACKEYSGEEIDEIVGTIARGVAKGVKKVANRLSTSGRADAAQAKLAKMKKKAADQARLRKAKSDIAALKKKKSGLGSAAMSSVKQKKPMTSHMTPESVEMKTFKDIREDAKHTKGATKPEGMHDKESKKSKDFRDKHAVTTNDSEEKGHQDAVAAGRKGPNGKKRAGDNPKGDKQIINKPKG